MGSSRDIGRRDFFRKFAQVAGVAAMAAGGLAVKPVTADAFFFGPKIDPRWKDLVSRLREYVMKTYVSFDMDRARSALESLSPYGITEADVTPLQNVNRRLLSGNMFLTYYYVNPATSLPSIKLFNIASQDTFDGFMVNGRKRTTLFGRDLGTYRRVLLGEEIFSTVNAAPVAMSYDLADRGAPSPEWVIAVPHGWIHDLYGRQASVMGERLVEELTIHEITHILHRTRDEVLPFLAQFGYRMDDDRPLTSVHDLIAYLGTRPATFSQAERLILERIDDADSFYGDTGSHAHIAALRQIKDAVVSLGREINRAAPAYPASLLRFSDQQCHACMAYLYNRAADRYALKEDPVSEPFAA